MTGNSLHLLLLGVPLAKDAFEQSMENDCTGYEREARCIAQAIQAAVKEGAYHVQLATPLKNRMLRRDLMEMGYLLQQDANETGQVPHFSIRWKHLGD